MFDITYFKDSTSLLRLRSFHVKPETLCDIFCQQLFVLLDDIPIVEESFVGGEDSSIIISVRDHIVS